MLVNAIKKGMAVKMQSGWKAVMADNKKGVIRMVTVSGPYIETGSEYVSKIAEVFNPETEKWESVELSPAQEKQLAVIHAAGF